MTSSCWMLATAVSGLGIARLTSKPRDPMKADWV